MVYVADIESLNNVILHGICLCMVDVADIESLNNVIRHNVICG